MSDLYTNLSREILLSLRGERSQSELSEMLGFSFNQVGKWETGATAFHWEDFVRLCEALAIPWKEQFESVFSFHSGMKLEENSVFDILSRFFGHASVREMATRLNKSRSSISRLLHDQVKIDFADVLRLMDQRPYVLSTWLSKFLDIKKLPSFREQAESEAQMFRGLQTVPWALLVNSALGIQTYLEAETHSAEFLAEKTGLTTEQVSLALAKLVEAGVIEYRDGKYKGLIREMTYLRVPEMRPLTRFLNQSISDAFRVTPVKTPNIANPSISSTRVYPMSSAAGKQIADILVRFHHEISEVVKQDQGPKDHVRAIVIHSLDLELLTDARKTSSSLEPDSAHERANVATP